MNPWGVVVIAVGAFCIYVGYRGTQGRVWQMITGNTALSTTSESHQLNSLPSGALPVHSATPNPTSTQTL